MVETLRRNPDKLFARACDKEFGCEDHFLRLHKDIKWEAAPEHYRDFWAAEGRADELHYWDPMLIPGLFQTEEYARRVLADEPGTSPDDVDAAVHRRMRRQALLTRAHGPLIVSLIDEGVLHRPVGEPSLMREQLDRLLEIAELPRVTVEIVPYDSNSFLGLLSGFAVSFVRGSAYVVHVDSSPDGRTIGDRDLIGRLLIRWNALHAAALPRRLSLEKIKEVRKRWT